MSTTENLTIMFTDIAGYSESVANMSRKESEQMLKDHDAALHKYVKLYKGNWIKSIGDSFLVIFRSPTDAALCGMAMHDAIWELSQSYIVTGKQPISIRVALNLGEVRLTRNDVFGEAVNIAARLESETPADEVYLTESVYLSMNKAEVNATEVGSKKFKGSPESIKYYRIPKGVARKVVAAVDPPDTEFNYPFGGAHLKIDSESQNISLEGILPSISMSETSKKRTGYITAGIIGLVALGFGGIWLMDNKDILFSATPTIAEKPALEVGELLPHATALFESKEYDALELFIEENKANFESTPELLIYRGHSNLNRGMHKTSLGAYAQAFEINPELSNDELTAKNLLELLRHQPSDTKALIKEHPAENIISLLAARSGQSGLDGRRQAAKLLRETGNESSIDEVGFHIAELGELETCPEKEKSVLVLKRLGDPRALPALKAALKGTVSEKIKYFCLRKETKAAIREIEGS